MKKVLLICLLVLVGIALGYGSYTIYKVHVKNVFVEKCVGDFMTEHKNSLVTPLRQAENLKIATQFCGCIYDKTEIGMPRFMAKLGCAFQIMMEQ